MGFFLNWYVRFLNYKPTYQGLRETCGKQLEAKNQELVERDEQISQLTNQVNSV